MNLFQLYQKKFIKCLKLLSTNNKIIIPSDFNNLTVEPPPKNQNADMSCNAAMILAKYNNISITDVGIVIKDNFLHEFKEFESIEIAKQGFLNFTFQKSFWKDFLLNVITQKTSYGANKNHIQKYNLEFVSANPTGPLHVGHCRGAILGDALSNLLKFNGHEVVKEYYVNDYGNQVLNFVKSIFHRIIQIKENKQFPVDQDLYPGEYIIDIAKKILNENKIKSFKDFEKIHNKLSIESLKISMDIIKNDLEMLGIKHNSFVYESNLVSENLVSKTIKKLEKKNFVYTGQLKEPKGEQTKDWKSRNQLLFKSTNFGDDTDRPLQKEDGSWTYFASDIAYHDYKIKRGFDILINILGADHTGYIKRIDAATKALSENKMSLICKVSQLVKLFKKGIPFKMSKRKGDYITVSDLVNEVGKDSVRFMMLNRSSSVELDFDFEKVAEKSKENPVYYVQYAYARINSIFNKINKKIKDDINIKNEEFSLNKHEIQILKKISEWPKCVEVSSKKLEPHRIPFYLYELSTLFHSYWNLGSENKEYRFLSNASIQNNFRLVLLQALAIVIENGMSILGVSTPNSM